MMLLDEPTTTCLGLLYDALLCFAFLSVKLLHSSPAYIWILQRYFQNQADFEANVKRFMKKNQMTIRKLPMWQNLSISLFQLFLAVYNRGGYEQVKRSLTLHQLALALDSV